MIKRATIATWANYFEKHEGVRISLNSIRNKLKEAGVVGVSGRDRIGRVLKNSYYSGIDVRQACAKLLHPMRQADESGFFMVEDVRFGTVKSWSRELGVSNRPVASRLRSAKTDCVRGRDSMGHPLDFYSELAVRHACADLFCELPQSDENGFFILGGVLYGTPYSWSRKLGVSAPSIISFLRSVSAVAIQGRDACRSIRDFYPEPVVQSVCAELLRDLPQADESGFFTLGNIRYGTLTGWSLKFGFSQAVIADRLGASSSLVVDGKGFGGQIWDFYPESAVRSACADLLRPMPQADESGFFIAEGVRHGTIASLARELGISEPSIESRVRSGSIAPREGRDRKNRELAFYPEPAVRSACADLLRLVPKADESGFFVEMGIRYGTVRAWSLELGISAPVLVSRFGSASMPSRGGKTSGGQIRKFYPEDAVRATCADFLRELPKADETGFFVSEGVRYGTVSAWCHEMEVSEKRIQTLLRHASVPHKKGRIIQGNFCDFYPEPAVREVCRDLIENRNLKLEIRNPKSKPDNK